MDKPTDDVLSEEQRSESLKLLNRYRKEGVDNKNQVKVYDETCTEYEKCFRDVGYTASQEIARTMEELFPHNRDQLKILDAAAGTGLAGIELFIAGFTNLDAVDASAGMLGEARKKNIYTRLICEFLGENKLPIKERIYDAVTMCAWGGPGDQGIFEELASVIKPGGLLVNVTRIFGTHVNEKKWKLESTRLFSRFYFDCEGIVYVYRII